MTQHAHESRSPSIIFYAEFAILFVVIIYFRVCPKNLKEIKRDYTKHTTYTKHETLAHIIISNIRNDLLFKNGRKQI